ncbi:MAG: ATP-binding protein [Methylotenera sp.]|nr:ATP-binding protein [Methylotenera sp.]
MKKQFVKTENYERFRTGITAVENRGAAEASLMLVTAEAGFGKSTTVDHWAIQSGAAYVRAKEGWTPAWFKSELAENLKLDTRGRPKDMFARIAGYIGSNQIPIVIDEVEHCLENNAAVLEAVRDLSDLTEVLVILVGMDQVQARIARHRQISSRIARVVEFQPASINDVLITCKQLAEVDIADDLVTEIHRASGGRMRDIMNAIATIENTAKRNGATNVTLADMAGQSLTHDWQSRRPRIVKAGGR